MKTGKMKKTIKTLVLIFAAAVLLACAAVFAVNAYVMSAVKGNIVAADKALLLDADCVLVLGAGVYADGTPSPMLADRLDTGIGLYELGVSDRLLMSGDHGRKGYDEVNSMKSRAVEAGVPSDDVFMDHAGFSTYESLYRAQYIFGVERVVVVTQSYHLYRALYIARALGIEAVGVSADLRDYPGQTYRDAREALARVKDFACCIFKPEPTFLGETIPITGPGSLTDG